MQASEYTRKWTWRSALAALALLVGSSYGCLAYVGRPLAWPGSPGPFLILAVAVVAIAWGLMAGRGGRRATWAALALAVLLGVALSLWYVTYEPSHAPYADNADALLTGMRQVLHGRSPYAVHTFLNGPITPMLGGFLLALPFVAIGSMYLQQVVWLLVGGITLSRAAGFRALAMALLLFASSPWARMGLPYQSDTWIAAAGVAVTGSWGWQTGKRARPGVWFWVSSVLFGVALAYRFIFWIAVVPLLVLWLRQRGLARTLRWFWPAGVVTVVLAALPFAFDRVGYLEGPIGTGVSKANHDAVPGATWIVFVATMVALAVGSRFVRCLADAWGVTAAALATMVAAVCATKLPALGWKALSTYDTLAYNGAFLVVGLVSLALPTVAPSVRVDDARDPARVTPGQ